MPIVGERPIQQLLARAEDWRRLEFWPIDGSEDMIGWTGIEWIMQRGVTGLDMAPREIITQQDPDLDGAELIEIRTLPRNVMLPVMLNASDGSNITLRGNLDRLRGYFDYRTVDYAALEGTFDLVAVTPNSLRRLRCIYSSGAEGEYTLSSVGGKHWQKYGIELLAVDPNWHGKQWSTPVVSLEDTTPFLSEDPTEGGLDEVFLTPTLALGQDMPVTIGGTVPSPATLDIVGPASSVHITSPNGLDVTLGAISAGQEVLLDTGRIKRLLVDGATNWDLLGDSPQWEPLPPGDAFITINMADATSASSARVYGDELWETSW
jgi:hypothetical protein